jgi:transposase InsO family protein
VTRGRTAILAVGLRLRHDGETYTVTALSGTDVTLRCARGRSICIGARALLADPSTDLLLPQPPAEDGLGALLSGLTAPEAAELRDRLGHVQEMLTGFRSGAADTALPGEPRADFHPGRPLTERYEAKAQELGLGVATIRRWAGRFRNDGPAGLLDGRGQRSADLLVGIDQRWLDACAAVLNEHTDASRPSRQLVLERVEARLALGDGQAVPRPSGRGARRALTELSRGTNAFVGSTKAKRSIANRPAGVYGRLRATRPGEYLLLDTTRLDVFAMEPLTLRWVNLELTIALDLYSRCIAGLRLSPVSTKAVDAALILYEAIKPDSQALTGCGVMPYAGVPSVVLVDADRLDGDRDKGLPAVAPETLVVDHGKIYLSEHLLAVCARLGISIQPARPLTPTDKAPVERFFRTLTEQLLAALPGYKGPDIYSRGKSPEAECYFFVDELERIMREWVATVYHHRPHDGLVDPKVPGLHYSPAEMFDQGVARAGRLRIPARADLVYDFLPVAWRTIQHYGVEVNSLRYNAEALTPHRNRTSPYTGANAGKWPLRFDPDDVSRLYFQDPDDNSWHTLLWEHAQDVPVPFSGEALVYARRLAAERDRFPDDRRVLAELLERWDAGLARNPTERRMALRLSQQRDARQRQAESGPGADVLRLPTVQAVIEAAAEPCEPDPGPAAGDDDGDGDLDAQAPDEAIGEIADADYYADAFESLA